MTAPTDQYRALISDVALVDRSGVGRLHFAGSDAVDLLDRLSTNKIAGLTPGGGVSTVLTTNKGRIIDLLTVVASVDHLLALGSRDARTRVMEWIDFYTFEEDVTVSDQTEHTFMAALAGPTAAAAVRELAGDAAADLPRYGGVEAEVGGVGATVIRSDFLAGPAFDFIVQSADEMVLTTAMGAFAEAVGPETVDAVRIGRGVPAFGSELNEDRNPLEAGLIDSISFDKGCYVGQEVVARLNTYDKVQRRLAMLNWEESPPNGGPNGGGGVSPGDEVFGEGKKIGVVTSVAAHPDGGFVGLAYVRRAYSGTKATIPNLTPGPGLSVVLRPEAVPA